MRRLERKGLRVAFIAVFVLLALGIGIAGLAYYFQQKAHLRASKFEELAAIADLKILELTTWRKEQIANASAPLRNPLLGAAIRRWLVEPGSKRLQQDLEKWMRGVRENYGYRSLLLLDARGRVRMTVPGGVSVDPDVFEQILQTPSGSGPVFADIHRHGPNEEIVFSLFTPLPDAEDPRRPPVGFYVLNIDPENYLFPFIQSWPTPSPSAETLLVKKEGDWVISLNELRHQPGTALTLRFPLSRSDLPGVRAFRDLSGEMEGRDYRGVTVLAVFRPVQGFPWELVAKVDQAETYAPLRQSALLVGLLVAALIAGAGAMLLFLSGRQTARFYKEQKVALEERDRARTEVFEMERRSAEGLREAKEIAEEASRAKSEFLAHMSHELRTPLTVIMGYLEILQDGEPSPQQRQFLASADGAARRLLNIIDDLLDISRIEAQRLKIEERPYDPRECVRQAIEMFAIQAREKRVNLHWEVAPEVPKKVMGDPARIGQILVNLVGNAIKFTERGEVAVKVARIADGLEFTVRDTGIGIAADRLHEIFAPFAQADSSLTRRYGGTGLGLTICRELVQLMGGNIRVESREGKGSVFSFLLPLHAAIPPEGAMKDRKEVAG